MDSRPSDVRIHSPTFPPPVRPNDLFYFLPSIIAKRIASLSLFTYPLTARPTDGFVLLHTPFAFTYRILFRVHFSFVYNVLHSPRRYLVSFFFPPPFTTPVLSTYSSLVVPSIPTFTDMLSRTHTCNSLPSAEHRSMSVFFSSL